MYSRDEPQFSCCSCVVVVLLRPPRVTPTREDKRDGREEPHRRARNNRNHPQLPQRLADPNLFFPLGRHDRFEFAVGDFPGPLRVDAFHDGLDAVAVELIPQHLPQVLGRDVPEFE